MVLILSRIQHPPLKPGRFTLAEAVRIACRDQPRGIPVYPIHYMAPPYVPTPGPYIALARTNWEWEHYGGSDLHTSHLHISADHDIYTGGSPSGLADYDSTLPWLTTAPLTPAPTTPKEDTDMSAAEVNTILNAIGDKAAEVKKYVAELLIYEYATGGRTHPGIGKVVEENQRRVNTANAKLAALENVVGQLAKGQGVAIDYNRINASIKSALADGIEITGTILAKDGAK